MSGKTPKTTDALMRYLRKEKGIQISGSAQKQKLMNMGYYHGYKGYRYVRKASNIIPYTSFQELTAVYEFDAQLKTMLYPAVMQIETALKNYVLDVMVCAVKSDSFLDVYSNLLDNYKQFSTAGKKYSTTKARKEAEERYKKELKRRLDLRNRIYKVQTDAFQSGNKIAVHYLNRDINLPVWAIFELLSLGEFGHFVSCLNFTCRQEISSKLGIRKGDDSSAVLFQRLVYALKDLRNAIAHNDVVFDTRFRTGRIDGQVGNAISNATGVSGLTFESITDYFVMILYLFTMLHIPKKDCRKLLSDYKACVERLRKSIPISVYHQIMCTDYTTKVKALELFLKQ